MTTKRAYLGDRTFYKKYGFGIRKPTPEYKTMRVMSCKGAGFHAIAKEIKLLFPKMTARKIYSLIDDILTAVDDDTLEDYIELVSFITYETEETYSLKTGKFLPNEEIALHLMDMARGYSKTLKEFAKEAVL